MNALQSLGNSHQNVGERILAALELAATKAVGSAARVTLVGLGAAVIGHYLGWDMAVLTTTPVLAQIIKQIGPNVLADLISRVAYDRNLTAEQIETIFAEKLAGLELERLPNKREFYQIVDRLRQLSATDRKTILDALVPITEGLAEITEALFRFEQRTQRIQESLEEIRADKRQAFPAIDLGIAAELLSALPTDQISSTANLPVGSRAVHHPNPLFAGRQAEFLTLAQALKAGQAVAITGPGGFGKTQLAVEFSHRYGQYFQGGVFWLNFGNKENLEAEIAACGLAIGLWEPDAKVELDVQIALTVQAWQAAVPRLLIFDNCEEEELLQKWRPKSGGTRVMITTRRSRWADNLDVITLQLDTLDRVESVTLLRNFRPTLEVELAEAIAAELGDLPLALALAGAYLNQYASVVTAQAYLCELRQPNLLRHASLIGRGSGISPTSHELNVARTFLVSYERLQLDNLTDRTASILLTNAACFAPGQPIITTLLLNTLATLPETSIDALLTSDALHRLTNLGLLELTTNNSADAVKMHRLIAAFVHGIVDEKAWATCQVQVERTIGDEAERVLNTGHTKPLLPWLPHLLHIVSVASKHSSSEEVRLVALLGGFWRLSGHCMAAVSAFNLALTLIMSNPESAEAEKAEALDNLGGALHEAGEPFSALDLHMQATGLFKTAYGTCHTDVAINLNNVGTVYMSLRAWPAAQTAFEQALAMHEVIVGSGHRLTTMVICNLGSALLSQGHLDRAQVELERALAIDRARQDNSELDIARDLCFLGNALIAKDELLQARAAFEEALRIDEGILGAVHPNIGRDISGLGSVFLAMGDPSTAYNLFARALSIAENIYSPLHANVATALNNIATALYAMGKQKPAHGAFSRALIIEQVLYGPNSPIVAIFFVNLGRFLHSKGDLNLARTAFENALAIDQAAYGHHHSEVATDLIELGRVLRDLGDLAGARNAFQSALAICEQVNDPNDPRTQLAHDNLQALKNG